jgi:uncharacterized metal-binding protein
VSDGKTHDQHGLILAAIMLPIVGFTAGWQAGALAAGGVVFGALWLSPDLDLDYSRPYKRWGPFRFVWWPYAQAFPHRGLSHHWFVGPISRLLYLALFVVPLWLLAGGGKPPVIVSLFVVGAVLGNWAHLLADGELF